MRDKRQHLALHFCTGGYRLLVLPDFVAVTSNGVRYLIETKGREDIDVANKERAASFGAKSPPGSWVRSGGAPKCRKRI